MPLELRPAATLRSIRLALLALNSLMFAVCALLLWQARQAEIRSAEVETVATVRLLEQGTRATLDKISIALTTVAFRLETQIAAQGIDHRTLWGLVDQTAALVPEVQRIGVFDAAGHQVCGLPVDRCQHLSIGDRDYFERLRLHPDTTVTMSGPYPSRVDDQASIILARALRGQDGSFAGVVNTVIPLRNLRGLIDLAKSYPGGAASLRTDQLQLLVRQPELAVGTDSPAASAVSTTLRDAIAAAPDRGVYRAVSPSDGIDRVTAYSRVAGYPVYAMVGQATDDFLAQWRLQLVWTAGFLLLFMAASVLLARSARISRERQEAAQRLYDEAPCGYHSLDEQGRFRRVNLTELAWLGCTRDELIGKLGVADFLSDESRATFTANFPVFKRTGRLDALELDLVGRQGQRRRVMVEATAVSDRGGNFVLSNSVMHDVTALHQVRQALAEQARQQGLMLDTDLIGIARLKGRRIVWANRGMVRIFGYQSDEWCDMPAHRLYPDQASYEQTGNAAYRQVRGGSQFRAQLQMRRKDGTLVWIDSSVTELDPSSGEVMLLIVDITALKAAEQARVRGIELESQNVALREGSRVKDEFLANMSHELRTPLTAVTGFTQLLQSGRIAPESPRFTQMLAQIGASGQHLLRLIETMLDYAAIEAGKFELAPTQVDVRKSIDDLVELLQPEADRASVDLVTMVVDDLRSVVTDRVRLNQILFHLASNAVKFSRPGGVVEIHTSIIDERRWRIDVLDQGQGIATTDLPRLFAPFVQLSSGSTKTHGGTGLGLALVRRIARAMGGDVQVHSMLGQGSTFSLILARDLSTASAK